MKNKLFPILAAVIVLLACKKEEDTQIKEASSIQEFKTDKIVQELISNNEYFISNMESPTNDIIPLLKKANLNYYEQIQLSNSLGFKTRSDYILFFKIQSSLVNIIRKKYNFLEHFSKNDTQNLLKEVSFNNLSSNYKTLMLENKCDKKFKNCSRLSNIVYTAEVLGCTATAMGIGALSGGIGGIFFQLACGATAIEHLQAMRTECQLNYEDCK